MDSNGVNPAAAASNAAVAPSSSKTCKMVELDQTLKLQPHYFPFSQKNFTTQIGDWNLLQKLKIKIEGCNHKLQFSTKSMVDNNSCFG